MTYIRKPAPDAVQRLFVAATELLEDEVAVAVAGQAASSKRRRQRQLVKRPPAFPADGRATVAAIATDQINSIQPLAAASDTYRNPRQQTFYQDRLSA